MTQAGYVFAGYAVTFASLTAYSVWVVTRHRSLRRHLHPTQRPGQAAGGTADPRC